MQAFKRAFIIVLDSFGIGAEPDAKEFGDGDCNTLRSIVASKEYDTPNMKKLGLFNIDGGGPANRRLCPPARALARQGYDDGPLGDCGHRLGAPDADVSGRLPAGSHRRA